MLQPYVLGGACSPTTQSLQPSDLEPTTLCIRVRPRAAHSPTCEALLRTAHYSLLQGLETLDERRRAAGARAPPLPEATWLARRLHVLAERLAAAEGARL